MQHTELLKAINIIGSQKKLAKLLGVSRYTLNHWVNRDIAVPLKCALILEVVTDGIVKSESLVPLAKDQILNFKKYLIQKT